MKFEDQMGNAIKFNSVPKRVVSLVPSQTEFLYEIGIRPIAQTIFCIHPKSEFKQSTKIGGTKKLNIEKIRSLKPDLIIGNKEENLKAEIEILAEEFPVWMSDIHTLEDAYEMMDCIGQITDKVEAANKIIKEARSNFNSLDTESNSTVLYLIWQKPFMAVGKPTFIDAVLTSLGFNNVASNQRYPQLNKEAITELNPYYIFLSSEPFPFKEKHQKEVQDLFPGSKVILVDGEMFSWYGSRLVKAPAYFKKLLSQLKD